MKYAFHLLLVLANHYAFIFLLGGQCSSSCSSSYLFLLITFVKSSFSTLLQKLVLIWDQVLVCAKSEYLYEVLLQIYLFQVHYLFLSKFVFMVMHLCYQNVHCHRLLISCLIHFFFLMIFQYHQLHYQYQINIYYYFFCFYMCLFPLGFSLSKNIHC